MTDVLAVVRLLAIIVLMVFILLIFGKELRPLVEAIVNYVLKLVKA